jgi:hypothetical protein
VILHARIRRFRCLNRRCRSVTFAERLDGVARPFARVTDQVQALIDATGHAAGGLPGERLLRKVGVVRSADTILRHLKRRAAANIAMSCGRPGFWPRHARAHRPEEGHACVDKPVQGTVCKILDEQEVKAARSSLPTICGGMECTVLTEL